MLSRRLHHEKHFGFEVVSWLGINLDAAKNDYFARVLVLVLDEVQEVVPSLFVENIGHLSDGLLRRINAFSLLPDEQLDVVHLHVEAHRVCFRSLLEVPNRI